MRSAHGVEAVEENVSTYYLADELAGMYRGMMVALPREEWEPVRDWDVPSLARWLKELAKKVRLSRFQKHPRGPKKPRQRRTRFARNKHISTAKLLAAEESKKRHP